MSASGEPTGVSEPSRRASRRAGRDIVGLSMKALPPHRARAQQARRKRREVANEQVVAPVRDDGLREPPPSPTSWAPGDRPASAVSAAPAIAAVPQRNDHVGWLQSATLRVVMTTGVRQLLTVGLSAITALLMARLMGPHDYGVYTAGVAAAGLVGSFANVGVGLTATREMAQQPEREAEIYATALTAQAPVGLVMGAVLVVIALVTTGERGHVMLVMVPSVVFVTLALARQVFTVHYDPMPLAVMDVTTTVLQSLITLGLLVAGASVVLVALNVSLWSVLCSVLAFVMARRHLRPRWFGLAAAWAMIKRSILVGFVMTLASLYFTIDMALLGWLVPAAKIGHYAVSVRLLNLITMVPSLVMAAGVPGIARLASDRAGLTRLLGSLTGWIALGALPLIVGVGVFAYPALLVVFGRPYLAAVPLVRVMMLAGVLTLANNVLGVTLVTLKIVRQQVYYNLFSLVINVTGNIVLAPRYGVLVSAWLTVASELIVLIGGALLLRRHVHYGAIVTAAYKPLVASAVGGGVGLALGAHSPLAIVAAVVTFLIAAAAIGMLPTAAQLRGLLGGRGGPAGDD